MGDLRTGSRSKDRGPARTGHVWTAFAVLLRVAQDRMSANDENASQIAVALLGDRPELLLAAGRILARHEPNPGREIAPRPECRRVRDRRRDRGRPDETDTGDGLQPLACLVPPMLR